MSTNRTSNFSKDRLISVASARKGLEEFDKNRVKATKSHNFGSRTVVNPQIIAPMLSSLKQTDPTLYRMLCSHPLLVKSEELQETNIDSSQVKSSLDSLVGYAVVEGSLHTLLLVVKLLLWWSDRLISESFTKELKETESKSEAKDEGHTSQINESLIPSLNVLKDLCRLHCDGSDWDNAFSIDKINSTSQVDILSVLLFLLRYMEEKGNGFMKNEGREKEGRTLDTPLCSIHAHPLTFLLLVSLLNDAVSYIERFETPIEQIVFELSQSNLKSENTSKAQENEETKENLDEIKVRIDLETTNTVVKENFRWWKLLHRVLKSVLHIMQVNLWYLRVNKIIY